MMNSNSVKEKYMTRKYILESIVHSCVKDERGKPVEEEKYDGIVGATVKFDENYINVGERFIFWFLDHKYCKWWNTNVVLDFNIDDEYVTIETYYSIYKFRKLEEKNE